MSRHLNWLLAGAAITLLAGAGSAIANDAGTAEAMAKADSDRAQVEAARDRAEAARDRAEATREKVERARKRGERHVHVYRAGDVTHRFESREAHLRDILQIRPEQEAALKAYVEATKREHGDHLVRFDREGEAPSTLQRLDEMEARMAEQQAAMKARIAATRAFYNQLDARQKKAFDAMPMVMMAGPHVGPMMIPLAHHHGPMLRHHRMPLPPPPPVPPVPPTPPSDL